MRLDEPRRTLPNEGPGWKAPEPEPGEEAQGASGAVEHVKEMGVFFGGADQNLAVTGHEVVVRIKIGDARQTP